MKLLIIFVFLPVIASATELENKCRLLGDKAVYFRGSCFHISSMAVSGEAIPACDQITSKTSYPGHLAFILDKKTAIATSTRVPTDARAYIGVKKEGIFYWYLPGGAYRPFATNLIDWLFASGWEERNLQNSKVTLTKEAKLDVCDPAELHYYMCQYREKDSCFVLAKENKLGSDLAKIATHANTDGTDCAQYCLDVPVCQSFSHNETTCVMYTYMSEDMQLQEAQNFRLCEKA